MTQIKFQNISNTEGPIKIQFILICVSAGLIVILLLIYYLYFRTKISLAFQIIMLLFFNQLGVLVAQFLPFFNTDSNALCQINLVLRTGFTIATNFWSCFIARMIYTEAKQPGKFIVLWEYILKNILYTYLPSIIISGMIAILILINPTNKNIKECWRSIANQDIEDYFIYILAFLLPSFLTLVIVLNYIIAYLMTNYKIFNIFMLIPIAQAFLSLYYLIVKSYLLVWNNFEYSDIFYECQPIIYSIIFIILINKSWNHRQSESESLSVEIMRDNPL